MIRGTAGLVSFAVLAFSFAPGARAASSGGAFETLRSFYRSADGSVTWNDITNASSPGDAMACVAAFISDIYPFPVYLYRYDHVVIPGIPAQGPLFPGTSDRTIDHCLLINADADGSAPQPSDSNNQFCQYYQSGPAQDGFDFNAINSDHQIVQKIATFKKNRGLLTFRMAILGSSDTETLYGYCFPGQ